MNLFRSTAFLLFVATSATAQRDAIDEHDGYIKFLRQAHGEKSHGDYQHQLVEHADVEAPDLTDSPSKLEGYEEIRDEDSFIELVNEYSFERLVVIEFTDLR